MIPDDKQKHLMAGAFISGTAYSMVHTYSKGNKARKAFWFGFAAGTLAGVAKEVKDEIDYGGFDVKDLAFTMAGSLTTVVIIEIARYKPKKHKKKLF